MVKAQIKEEARRMVTFDLPICCLGQTSPQQLVGLVVPEDRKLMILCLGVGIAFSNKMHEIS